MKQSAALLILLLGLATGIAAHAADVAHVIVPLADNENQNIAPVSKALGNGQNLSTNLYWGAMYGAKTFLRNSSKFSLVACEKVNEKILERCEFKHKKTSSVVILEAYAGDQLKLSLNSFFELAGGSAKGKDEPSLVIFSGHNGLMDYPWKIFGGVKVVKAKKVAILACQSKTYFKPSFSGTGVTPVIVTKTNMAPEGYILEELLDGYFTHNTNEEIKLRVAKAYAKYQKISLKAALTVFATSF